MAVTNRYSYPAPPGFDSVLFGGGSNARHLLTKQPEATPSVSTKSALKQVVQITGVPIDEIYSTRRGPDGNPARALAIWWLIHGAGQTNAMVGEMMGISPSVVSRILKKFRNASDKYLGGRLSNWQEKLLNKDQ